MDSTLQVDWDELELKDLPSVVLARGTWDGAYAYRVTTRFYNKSMPIRSAASPHKFRSFVLTLESTPSWLSPLPSIFYAYKPELPW